MAYDPDRPDGEDTPCPLEDPDRPDLPCPVCPGNPFDVKSA